MRGGGTPSGGEGFGLGAEPALPRAVHADAAIPGAPGHVIDQAIAADIAFNGAAIGGAVVGDVPSLGAIFPGWGVLGFPNAAFGGARFGFDCDVSG